jgi:hypothetical protein
MPLTPKADACDTWFLRFAFDLLRVPLVAFPSAVLGAAVLAAEEVSFVLVGSAALWLRDAWNLRRRHKERENE